MALERLDELSRRSDGLSKTSYRPTLAGPIFSRAPVWPSAVGPVQYQDTSGPDLLTPRIASSSTRRRGVTRNGRATRLLAACSIIRRPLRRQ